MRKPMRPCTTARSWKGCWTRATPSMMGLWTARIGRRDRVHTKGQWLEQSESIREAAAGEAVNRCYKCQDGFCFVIEVNRIERMCPDLVDRGFITQRPKWHDLAPLQHHPAVVALPFWPTPAGAVI